MIGRPRPRAGGLMFAQNEVLLSVSQIAYTLAPGHEARRLACVVCDQAIGGAPVRVIGVITGVTCPADGVHLLAGGHLRHDACPHPADAELAAKLVSIITADSD
jgi:hypothetical protein